MKLPWKTHNRLELVGRPLRECFEDIRNPGRGWYHIYTFVLAEWEKESLAWLMKVPEESLVLLLIDIGDYRKGPIAEEGIAYLEKILTFFEAEGKDIILRIAYDTQGSGMEKEPPLSGQVISHMQQLGPVVAAHSQGILLFQGLFVGNWGEMHGSKFLGKEPLKKLTGCWKSATEGKLRIAFRKPVYCRLVEERKNQSGGNVKDSDTSGDGASQCDISGNVNEIGFFDDAIFASATHLGTFAREETAEYGAAWRKEKELQYLASVLEKVPCGGEAVSGDTLPTPQEVAEELAAFHVTYLNSVHEKQLLSNWKNMPAPSPEEKNWSSLYDYVGAHLGYRFLVTKAQLTKKGPQGLEIHLENIGFASLTEAAELYIKFEYPTGESQELSAAYDLSLLKSGGKERIFVEVPEHLWRPGMLYLSARRKRGDRPIRFANEEGQNGLFLGELKEK